MRVRLAKVIPIGMGDPVCENKTYNLIVQFLREDMDCPCLVWVPIRVQLLIELSIVEDSVRQSWMQM